MTIKQEKWVITDTDRLDRFLKAGGALETLEVAVGQLTGKTKYAAGHVGSRSRARGAFKRRKVKPAELSRRAQMRAARKQLGSMDKASRKESIKALRKALKAEGISSKGLTTVKGRRVATAKVAGVWQAEHAYHTLGIRLSKTIREANLLKLQKALLRGRSHTQQLFKMGRDIQASVQRSVRKSGLVDSGKLIETTQFGVIDKNKRLDVIAARKAARKRRRR